MAEVPVPKITKARYFFIRFKEISEILLLPVAAVLVDFNIKAFGIAEVLASVAIVIEGFHHSIETAI